MRTHRSIVMLLAVALAASLPASGSATPACADVLVGVNERCPEWTGVYNHPGGAEGNREDVGLAVAVAPDNATVFVTGRSFDDEGGRDIATTAFAADTGATRWTSRYDGTSYDNGSAILAVGDRVFVTGRSLADPDWDWVTVAYDAATGEELWVETVAGALAVDDTAWSLAASPDGSTIYVGGTVDDGAGIPGDAVVVAYDAATGATRWVGRHDSGSYDGGFRIFASSDGERVYLAGGTRAGNDSMNLLAVAFEAADPDGLGTVVWSAGHGSGQGFDQIAGAALSPDESVLVVTGHSIGGTGAPIDVTTAAFDTADGARTWSAMYNGTRNASDTSAGVAIAGGNAIVGLTGAEGVAGFDFVTQAYDLETGTVEWTAVENGGANPGVPDRLYAIAGSPAGDAVFVTGQTLVPRMEIQPVFKIEPTTLTTYSYNAATGARRWAARYNESGIGGDAAVAITVSPDGQRVYPTGTFIFTGAYVYPAVAAKAYAWDMGVVAYPT